MRRLWKRVGDWQCRWNWHDWRQFTYSMVGPDWWICRRCQVVDCDEP